MSLSFDFVTSTPRSCRSLLRAMQCLFAMVLFHQAVFACSVPVFRYGLEHWKADPYIVHVLHQGALDEAAQALVGKLQAASTRANIAVRPSDITQSPSAELRPLGLNETPGEPWLVLQTPSHALVRQAVWSGPLSETNVAALLDSPARKGIATGIGEGESAVWVLLESGDKAADDAAASLLEARLNYLGTVMELPKLDEQDVRNGLVSLPSDGLRLSFSLVRISRNNPAEHIFVRMLLATEPDLKDAKGPIAFPVFGQGRALYALVDKGIKHETVDEAASFLIGSCSCQVKEKNPGADLLMAVDWKGLVRDQSIGLVDLPPASEIVGGKPETVTISAPAKSPPAPEPSRLAVSRSSVVLLTSATVFVILAAGAAIWRGRRKSS